MIGFLLKVCIFAIVAALAVVIVREQNKEIAIILVVVCSVAILIAIADLLSGFVAAIRSYIEDLGVAPAYFKTVFKIVFVAYAAQIACDIVEDMNVKSLSSKIGLTAKIVILALAMPVVAEFVDLIKGVL